MSTSKVVKIGMAMTLLAGGIFTVSFGDAAKADAPEGISIEERFKDPIFRNYVSENIDTVKDGILTAEEAEAVTELFFRYDTGIKDLAGIECFPNLKTLECPGGDEQGDNLLESLDISKNEKLEWLFCTDNHLTELDISKNTKLNHLATEGNQLKSLDIRNNPDLLLVFHEGFFIPSGWEHGIQHSLFDEEEYEYSVYDETLGKNKNYYLNVSPDVLIVDRTGWEKYKSKWYYVTEKGIPKTGWSKIQGSTYFFTADGSMASDEYRNGYWLNGDGTWTYTAKASWRSDSKGWWYQDDKGWYPKNQWLRIDGKWYFFKANGYMAANEFCKGYWLNADGTWTYKAKASWKKDAKGWYYSDTTGWYAKNQTLKIDGKKYSFDSAGYCTNP